MIGHDLGGHGSLHRVQIQGLRVARILLVVRRHRLAMEAPVQNLLHHRESTPAELQVKRDRLLAIESVGTRRHRHRVRRRPLRQLVVAGDRCLDQVKNRFQTMLQKGSTRTQLPASTRPVSIPSTMKQLALTMELRIPLP